jgi:hypothetical protein
MRDDGVSELLGYAILAGMVITAVVFLASGAGGAITVTTESAGFSEARLAVRSLAATASSVARANNTYFTAAEVQVPAGYQLLTLDGNDDAARFAVSCGGGEIFAVREGSIRLQSAFRSVSFEGGAVFSNDSGLVDIVRMPSIFLARHEEDATLYIFITALSTDSRVVTGGTPVVLDIRARSGQNVSKQADGQVTVAISSTCPEGWSAALENMGFTVRQEGSRITATMGGITDVCIDCVALQVRVE